MSKKWQTCVSKDVIVRDYAMNTLTVQTFDRPLTASAGQNEQSALCYEQ
jgi:hypothetical protein